MIKSSIYFSITFLFFLTTLALYPYMSKYHKLKAEVEIANELVKQHKREADDAVASLKAKTQEFNKREQEYRSIIDSYTPSYPVVVMPEREDSGGPSDCEARTHKINEDGRTKACGILLEEAFRGFEGILRRFEEDARAASEVNAAYASCRELSLLN